ncbi:MAG: hypothetical protein HZC54_13360 [Verrucomicrobia bacterium]|nr:hypothetical protein [Verrucomicrobiota bacterium]
MKTRTVGVVACLVSLLLAGPARTCDLCAIYIASEAQGAGDRGFYAGVAEQYTYFNTLQAENRTVPNDGEYLHSYNTQFYAAYRFNRRVGVQLNVPYLYKDFGSDAAGSAHESGLGDICLLGNYLLFEKADEDSTFRWNLIGGVKFPTGDPAHLNPEEPDFATGISGHDLALGSGSFDGIIGTGVYGRWHRFMGTASAQYGIRTEGAFGYRFANDLSWQAGPGYYLLLNENHTLALQLICSGETKGQDQMGDMVMPPGAVMEMGHTAETIVFLGPQLTYTFNNRLSALGAVDVPAHIHSTGDTLVPDLRVRASIAWRF